MSGLILISMIMMHTMAPSIAADSWASSDSSSLAPSISVPRQSGRSSPNINLIVGLIIVNLVVIVILVAGLNYYCRRRRSRRQASIEGGITQVSSEPVELILVQTGDGKSSTNDSIIVVPSVVHSPARVHTSVDVKASTHQVPGSFHSATQLPQSPHQTMTISTTVDEAANVRNTSTMTSCRSLGLIEFTYQELERATSGFQKENKLGRGGFGTVYKGILANNLTVAVKALTNDNSEDDTSFIREVTAISRSKHRNLVSLIGYCIDGPARILVLEFIPNMSLRHHLLGEDVLPWENRMKVAAGSARGLAYLHEDCQPRIIHRDIKADNILLDSKFEAKVADFGHALLYPNSFATHVNPTKIVGTYGYIAPENFEFGRLTDKSDVYSFGVVLLELITGRRVFPGMAKWAREEIMKARKDRNYDLLADQKLQNQYNREEMALMITCALACVNPDASERPPMIKISRVLEGIISPDELFSREAKSDSRWSHMANKCLSMKKIAKSTSNLSSVG